MNNQLVVAPVHEPINKVIDIGCGTGVVTQALRKHFLAANHIYGIDLTPTNLENRPSAATKPAEFILGDFISLAGTDARLGWGSVDFAWSRFLLCGLTNWPGYVERVFRLLKPGAWAQMVDFCEDFYFDPRLSSRPRDFEARRDWGWLRALREAGRRKGLDLDAGLHVPAYMEAAGFVDVRQQEFVVPYWREAVAARPEARLAAEMCVGDPYALYWHMLPRILEGMGFGEEEVRSFQENSRRDSGEEVGKYQVLHGREVLIDRHFLPFGDAVEDHWLRSQYSTLALAISGARAVLTDHSIIMICINVYSTPLDHILTDMHASWAISTMHRWWHGSWGR